MATGSPPFFLQTNGYTDQGERATSITKSPLPHYGDALRKDSVCALASGPHTSDPAVRNTRIYIVLFGSGGKLRTSLGDFPVLRRHNSLSGGRRGPRL